jgi:hypothetical protein
MVILNVATVVFGFVPVMRMYQPSSQLAVPSGYKPPDVTGSKNVSSVGSVGNLMELKTEFMLLT